MVKDSTMGDSGLASAILGRAVRIILSNLENEKSISLAVSEVEQLVTSMGLSKVPQLK